MLAILWWVGLNSAIHEWSTGRFMQFKRGFKILGFAMVIAMAAGCKSYTEKAAEGLPNSHTAGIRAIEKTLTIASVDGADTLYALYTQRTEYRLSPGNHRLEVKKWTGTRATRSIFRDVNLKAGREYGLKAVPSEDWWDFRIDDMETGERIDTPIIP
ncbi:MULTISPECIES: hypothetical protein [unclassified Pseudomonas]|uniref:hypothetical protein n=1 Tax=unclassified Pseudomonas TaxID=196821 RepID=UPI00136B18AD|nr:MULTISPECIES: hypothetical protein [unclassified Pseudomonas]MDD2032736.1 hypothetical protein [Pseudomonas sp. 39167]MEA1028377.1 hypothetical protein [Pseudomonas sp. N-137]MXR28435.1 hypothetical protein [Pseudomonas sp. PICF6]